MLRVGMLWFDDSPHRPLSTKIARAAAYYKKKYGRLPNICYVRSKAGIPSQALDGRIRVVPLKDILPDHLWLGVLSQEEPTSPSQH